jgi:aminoglycoside phosphotransferase (APT) family kinase protein
MNGAQRLFLKFDVDAQALRRLADLAVTPPVLHAGEYHGHSFVVQPYLRGHHPRHRWFDRHHGDLVGLVRAYQRDGHLRNLTSPSIIPTHQALLNAVVDDLEHRSRINSHPRLSAKRLARAIGQLRTLSSNLHAAELVPTHGDPNRKNFVLADGVYLLDWDDLALSDPLRDVGQLMWWYVPPSRWDDFFSELGLDGDDAVRDRLFWWVAAESLDVALTLTRRGSRDSANEFFDDFAAAIEQRPNPHARF